MAPPPGRMTAKRPSLGKPSSLRPRHQALPIEVLRLVRSLPPPPPRTCLEQRLGERLSEVHSLALPRLWSRAHWRLFELARPALLLFVGVIRATASPRVRRSHSTDELRTPRVANRGRPKHDLVKRSRGRKALKCLGRLHRCLLFVQEHYSAAGVTAAFSPRTMTSPMMPSLAGSPVTNVPISLVYVSTRRVRSPPRTQCTFCVPYA